MTSSSLAIIATALVSDSVPSTLTNSNNHHSDSVDHGSSSSGSGSGGFIDGGGHCVVSSKLEGLAASLIECVSSYVSSGDVLGGMWCTSRALRQSSVVRHLRVGAQAAAADVLRSIPAGRWSALNSLRVKDAHPTLDAATGALGHRLTTLYINISVVVDGEAALTVGKIIPEAVGPSLRELGITLTLLAAGDALRPRVSVGDAAAVAALSMALPALERLAVRVRDSWDHLPATLIVASAVPGHLRSLALAMELWEPQCGYGLAAHAPFLETLHIETRRIHGMAVRLPALPNAHTLTLSTADGGDTDPFKVFELAAAPHLKLTRLTLNDAACLHVAAEPPDTTSAAAVMVATVSTVDSKWRAPMLTTLVLHSFASNHALRCLSAEGGTSATLHFLLLHEVVVRDPFVPLALRAVRLELEVNSFQDRRDAAAHLRMYVSILASERLSDLRIHPRAFSLFPSQQEGDDTKVAYGSQLLRICTIGQPLVARPAALPSRIAWNDLVDSSEPRPNDVGYTPVAGRWSPHLQEFE